MITMTGKYSAIVLVLCMSIASAAISIVMLEQSVEDLYGNPKEQDAVSFDRVFIDNTIWPANGGSNKPAENMLLVSAATSGYSRFEGYFSYALPVELQIDDAQDKLTLNSYLIKAPDKKAKNFIFFPIATAFDEHKKYVQTLLPTEESRVKGNTISNVIVIPSGTKYLLIHTHPDYVTYDSDTSETRSDLPAQGAAAMFGAIGGVFYGAMRNFDVQRGKADIAPVGVVEIMKYDR